MKSQVNRDYVWVFGSRSDDPTSKYGTNLMNFNGSTLTLSKETMNMHFFVTNASISDAGGNLLFYTNGCFIHDASHNIMENGEGLNPGTVYLNGNCPNSGNTASNGAIILPLPGDSMKYYMFHASFVSGESGVFSIYIGKVYYSLIDMEMNNGLGAVVEKNQLVIEDSLSGELHAVKHANGEDWWVMVVKSHENKYFKILFTADGVSSITTQKIGLDPNPWSSGGGQVSFSPDGTKYARYTSRDQLFLFDFDRATGELSNFQHLHVDTTSVPHWGSLSFSSNSRYLYVGSQVKLWQFDMQAPDIQASKILVGEYDGYLYNGQLPTVFYLMQLAPDCKIYMVSRHSTDHLHVIHQPNEPGLACDFRQHDLKLAAVTPSSIPNFPNYRLDTPYPVCDSTIQYITSSIQVQPSVKEVLLYPNPAIEQVSLELPAPLPAEGEWTLWAATGQQVRLVILAKGQTSYTVSLAGLPPGLYFWKATSQGRRVGEGKVAVSK